ncbi:phage head closure protein [Iodobacter sp. CM08]|uniref:phage head closure protein n=1 Tax=Iodobacter sp. CM08 TaxID=3085902 RepID=UPI0029820F2D|nr:phage head closure protein [Iodobacter sp. CM08]MDW5417741.1 phage head closure protein [Iodobacter sp. CM08]
MNPGKLNKRITLKKRTQQRNSYGESKDVWQDFAKVWAEVHALRGYERTEAYLADARSSWRLVIRPLAGLSTGLRVQYGARVLEVKSVLPIASTPFIELICEAVE